MCRLSVWDLIIEGKYEEACRQAEEDSIKSASIAPLRNKVCALLNLHRYEDAAELCQYLIKHEDTNLSSSSDFIMLGISYWILERHEQAILAWHSGLDAVYRDAAGGISIPLILYYASIKLSDADVRSESLKKLRSQIRNRSIGNWPGPIAFYVLGKISEEELFARMSQHPVLYSRQACQTYFYIALMRYQRNDTPGFIEYVQKSCSQGPASMLEYEYYLAKYEVLEK